MFKIQLKYFLIPSLLLVIGKLFSNFSRPKHEMDEGKPYGGWPHIWSGSGISYRKQGAEKFEPIPAESFKH